MTRAEAPYIPRSFFVPNPLRYGLTSSLTIANDVGLPVGASVVRAGWVSALHPSSSCLSRIINNC